MSAFTVFSRYLFSTGPSTNKKKKVDGESEAAPEANAVTSDNADDEGEEDAGPAAAEAEAEACDGHYAADAPAEEPYTAIGRDREDVDDRRIALRFNPGLAEHGDNRFNWVSFGWYLPDPEPLSLEQRTRLFASEDFNKVAINGCLACKKLLINAITLKCSHMLCLPCFEKPKIRKMPPP